jgi:hypothetical protein
MVELCCLPLYCVLWRSLYACGWVYIEIVAHEDDPLWSKNVMYKKENCCLDGKMKLYFLDESQRIDTR